MGLVQIGCICLEDVQNSSNVVWLENLDEFYNQYFVEVTEGDESKVIDFVTDLISPQEIMDGEWDSYYIALDLQTTEDAGYSSLIKHLDATREKSKTTFYSGECLYRPVED
jgi:hypothetical protein